MFKNKEMKQAEKAMKQYEKQKEKEFRQYEKMEEARKRRIEKIEEKPVTLHMLTYDKERKEYTLNTERMERKLLPEDSVHVSGKKNEYLLHYLDLGEIPTGEMTAADLYLFMKNNDINDSFNIKSVAGGMDLDVRKLIIYGFCVALGLCIIYAFI